MTSNYRESFLRASTLRSSSIDDVYAGHFDLAIGFSGWDRRAVVLCGAKGFSADYGALYLFEKRDLEGVSAKQDLLLTNYYESHCYKTSVKEIESTNLDMIRTDIQFLLAEAYAKAKRPISIFVDLSTTPRYFSLGVMGLGFESGVVRSITYAYSEGEYDTDPKSADEEIFTEGGWNPVAIPGFAGEWEPHRKRHYIVSVGFEGKKTQQFLSRQEPDRVSLLFPDPPVKPGYEKITLEKNKALIRRFSISKDRIVRANAADIVDVLELLEQSRLEDFEAENCSYICCGIKPHSLALAFRAILRRQPAVLYIVPESHSVSYVKPNGVYWKYSFEDYSALGALS